MVDTASAYGNSEFVLGQIGVNDFKITTKIPSIPDNLNNIEKEDPFNDLFIELVNDYVELIKHTGIPSYTLVQDNPFKMEDPYHPKDCIYDEDEYVESFIRENYREELYGYISLDSHNIDDNECSDYENMSDSLSEDEDGEWVDIS